MEPRARVELATCRLRIGCSTTELPRPAFTTIASTDFFCQFTAINALLDTTASTRRSSTGILQTGTELTLAKSISFCLHRIFTPA